MMTSSGSPAVRPAGTPHLAVALAPEPRDLHGGGDAGAERTPWHGAAVALVLALAGAVAWLSTAGAPAEAVRHLPAAERAAVGQRALANLRDVCQQADRPRAFCVEQAHLALVLPECDAICQELAREELRADTARR